MRYLLFLISFLYSFWFYLIYAVSHDKNIFWQDLESTKNIIHKSLFEPFILSSWEDIIIQSFFWDLRIEMIFFLIIGFFLFFYFSAAEVKKEKILEKESFFTKEKIAFYLHKFSYYIWFLFFYLSLFLISKGFDFIEFSGFVLWVNICIFAFFYLSKFSKLSLDFLKINSILFSFSYIFSYIYIILSDKNIFGWIDILNSFLIIVTFWVLLFFDKKIHKKQSYDYSLVAHLSVYLFFVCLFYLNFYILSGNILFWTVWICSIFWVIWFEWLPKISLFSSQIKTFRYIGILFSYFWVFLWILFLLFEKSISVMFLLLFQSAYHLFIHKKYVNVISFGTSILSLVFVFFYFIFDQQIVNVADTSFFIVAFSLSFVWIISTYFFQYKTIFDYYIIHILSHILNVASICIFLFFHYKNLHLSYIWILLLLESIYFFWSYHKLVNFLKK